MKNILFLILFTGFVFSGCQTVDLEPKNEIVKEHTNEQVKEESITAEAEGQEKTKVKDKTPEELAVDELKASLDLGKQIVYVERPVYIPASEAGKKTISGIPSVQASTDSGTMKPEEYSHAARMYHYNPDQVFEVYCQVLRTTDIYLEPGEIPLLEPVVADSSDRWVIGAGVSQQDGRNVQHIYVKPKFAGLESSMIINTDRRVYHIVLRSYNTVYMPMVKWTYFDDSLPKVYVRDLEPSVTLGTELEYLDPRFLSFDYTLSFGVFGRKPAWMPQRVYDDGKKTYIVFDQQVLQRELPGIFENKDDVVNYRVKDNLVIIDKLIERISVKYQDRRITIEKKRS